MSAQRQETQPRTYRLSLKALLAFPFRICNPPPAVGKVRSCGVTPLLNIRLQDILERKHLPPLGLKDFEEWLLYVEICPENLYFTLWLKEYTVKYQKWAADSKAQRDMAGEYRIQWPIPSSSHLAMFYARAKQTFFMPNSTYELDLPSDMLAPFHASDLSQHPDPIMFHEVSQATQQMLEKSLGRFVQAQLNNVGNNRVLCGMIAGVSFCLLGTVPPLVVNFTQGDSRWTRLAAFPGMLIGLTIFLAALNGVCLGVYVFGDLRQLHKFELARPPISKPRLLRTQRQRPSISLPLSAPPPPPHMVLPLTQPPRLSIVPPPRAHVADHRLSRTSTVSSQASSCTSGSCSSGSSYSAAEARIEVSAAYYDTDPVDGPATSPVVPESNFTFPGKLENGESNDNPFTPTAGFIHPYEHTLDSDSEYDISKLRSEEHQPISPFDFDALPVRSTDYCRSVSRSSSLPDHEILEIKTNIPPLKISFSAIIERIQLVCNIRKWLIVTRNVAAESTAAASPRSSFGAATGRPKNKGTTVRRNEKGEAVARKRFKMVTAVPAFSSLTRILSPVVVRAQWEIVVRSGVIAFLITWIILGSLLAIPTR